MVRKIDWDNLSPQPAVVDRFLEVTDEDSFPETYSGQSWKAAYRIWKMVKDDPSLLDKDTDYHPILDNLGLSGFMVGWAVNAVRVVLGRPQGPNPAVITLGVENQPVTPALGPAEQDLKRIL